MTSFYIILILIIVLIVLLPLFYVITSIQRYLVKSYEYAVRVYDIPHDYSLIWNYKPITKAELNHCGTACVNKQLITNAPNMSFNNWNEDQDTRGASTIKGILLVLQFVKASFDNRYAVPICTGGSSGNSFLYWYNYDEGIRFLASTMRCWIPYGWNPTKLLGIFYGHPSSGLSFMNKVHTIIPNIHVLVPSYKEGDLGCIDAFVDFVNIRKPFVIETMPNLFFRACELCYMKDIKITHQPTLISLSGDFIFTCQYRFIQACFPRSIVRLAYGSVEVGQIAQQVDDSDIYLYKVFAEYAYVENKNSKLVISRLDYQNMPMYRYITDDYGDVHTGNDGQQYIKNLVGKKRYDYLDLDRLVNKINDEHDVKIINVRINLAKKHVQFTSLLADVDHGMLIKYFPGYEVEVIACARQSCKTTDRFDTKVLPLLS